MKSKLPGRIGRATFAVLTITENEFEAASRILGANQNIARTGYYVPTLDTARSPQYDFVLRRAAGRSNVVAGIAAGGFVEDFRPSFLLLVGTAGGVKGCDGISCGDILIADFVDYIEFQKIKANQYIPRKTPFDHPSLWLRQNFAERLRVSDHSWRDYLAGIARPDANEPQVRVGNLAAGEKIFSDQKNHFQKRMIKLFDKAQVFETESFGVASQIYNCRTTVDYNPQYLPIRGVSDLIDVPVPETSDEQRKLWTPYAAAAAAAFARKLIELVLQDRP